MSGASCTDRTRGFTLVELMVTVTIMMIMTGVVFFNYGKFNESSLMNQVAYDLSLTIRQAQVYGVATREGGSSQSGRINTDNADINSANFNNFKSSYGVHFSTALRDRFILFIDAGPVPNGVYDSGEIILQTYTFQREIKIKKLCFVGVSEGASCGDDDSGKLANSTLDITFKRPDPEAIIVPNNSPGAVNSATIYLESPSGIPKSVVVYSTGQISVQ